MNDQTVYEAKTRPKHKANRRVLDKHGIFHSAGPKPTRRRQGKSTLTRTLNKRIIARELFVEEAQEIMKMSGAFTEKQWESISKQLKGDYNWHSLEKGDLDMQDLAATDAYKKEFGDESLAEGGDDAPVWVEWKVAEMKAYLLDVAEIDIPKGAKKGDLQELMKKHYKEDEESAPAGDQGSGDDNDKF